MFDRFDLPELNALRVAALRQEAEHERLVQEATGKTGWLRQSLDTLFRAKAE